MGPSQLISNLPAQRQQVKADGWLRFIYEYQRTARSTYAEAISVVHPPRLFPASNDHPLSLAGTPRPSGYPNGLDLEEMTGLCSDPKDASICI